MSKQNNYHIVERGSNSSFRVAKTLCLAASLLFFLNLFIAPVSAQEAITSTPKTEIIQNDEAGTVSILIDGKTVGVFTRNGLHVLGNIVYSGAMIDGGPNVLKDIPKSIVNSEAVDDENQ